MDRSDSTQSCREQKKGQNEWAELFFICQVCIYRKKKSRMVEYTTFTVRQGEDNYRLLFLFSFFFRNNQLRCMGGLPKVLF